MGSSCIKEDRDKNDSIQDFKGEKKVSFQETIVIGASDAVCTDHSVGEKKKTMKKEVSLEFSRKMIIKT